MLRRVWKEERMTKREEKGRRKGKGSKCSGGLSIGEKNKGKVLRGKIYMKAREREKNEIK